MDVTSALNRRIRDKRPHVPVVEHQQRSCEQVNIEEQSVASRQNRVHASGKDTRVCDSRASSAVNRL